jgi:probable HAF family extracellular repeat protein
VRRPAAVALIAFAQLLAAPSESSAATFTAVGDLPGGSFHSIAAGLSADGSTVVGRSNSASGPEAFRRANGSTIEGLGDLAGGAFSSEATAVSADGSIVVGASDGDLPPLSRAFRWTDGSGMEAIPDFWGGTLWHVAQDVTADGSIVAGWNYLEFLGYLVGFNGWLVQGNTLLWQLETLTQTPYGQAHSPEVRAISADGSVWAGMVIFDPEGLREGVVWTDGGSVVTFIDNGAGVQLHGLSADGTTAVGAIANEAFAWTATGGVVPLGDLAGGSFASSALDASADGSVVVGYGTTELGSEAFVWDAANGMRHLGDLLACRGAAPTGWTKLSRAVAVSDDARTIAGWGINPQGDTEAWTATVPFLAIPCGPATIPTTSNGGVAILVGLMVAVACASRSRTANKAPSRTL